MLLPLGLEDSKLDRVPYVSIAIAVISFVAFLATWVLPERSGTAEGRLQEALIYWAEHPYLELPAEIENQIPPELIQPFQDLTDQLELPSPEVYHAEQRLLDDLFAHYRVEHQRSVFAHWGLVPANGLRQPGWLTYMFLHFGWLHLLGNLLFFYVAAPLIEDRWGRPLFGVFYLLGGVAAGLAQVLLDRSSGAFVVGASGAVAACMGAFAFRFPKQKVKLLVLLIVIPVRFSIRAWVWSICWFLAEVGSLADYGAAGNVAFMAHVGGWLFGFGAAALLGFLGFEEKYIAPHLDGRVQRKPIERSPSAFMPGFIGGLGVIIMSALVIRFVPAKAERSNASIHVSSSPSNAEILVDGRRTGLRTPETIAGLRPRRPYRVTVALDGHQSAPRFEDIVIPRTLESSVAFELQPIGNLVVVTDPPGALVQIDARPVGRSPLRVPPIVVGKKAEIHLDRDGYMPADRSIVVQTGTSTIAFELEPAVEIQIVSDPLGADAFLDGVSVGPTPASTIVPISRKFTVEVRKPGFVTASRRMLRPKAKSEISLSLAALPLSKLPLSPDEREELIDHQKALDRLRSAVSRARQRFQAATHARTAAARRSAAEKIRADDALDEAKGELSDLEAELEDEKAALGTLRERAILRLSEAQYR